VTVTQGIDRRTFLKLLSAASALPIAEACGGRAGNRVVVLGGGLAGLASAWNLMIRGYDVIVLEAQDRPGGRVKTLREPFHHGGYAEAGAVRIPDNHRWTMKYIRLLGLESKLAAYDDDAGAHLWYLEGKRFTTPKGEWPLNGLSDREKTDPFGQVGAYWAEGFEAIGDPAHPDFPGESALALDAFALPDYFKAHGASDAWVRLILAAEGDARRLSALAVTMVERSLMNARFKTYGLVGGNDQLPKALAAALGARVKYGTAIVRLAPRDRGVTVTVRDASGQHDITADRCVCALPFPVLRGIEITPPFSEPKMEAIRGYDLVPCARVSFQTRTRFWREDPLGALGGLNMIGTDTPAERIWNTSHLQPDRTMGMLHSYMIDAQAAAFAETPAARRVAACVEQVASFLPRLPEEIVATAVTVWQEDPWARGAFALTEAGRFQQLWPVARRPERLVHFAGEHTSPWMGWQNGALESAERCVQEIVSAS
jgi:monoamine oxidase